METERSRDILAKVDALLAGKELAEEPRALLLLRMCQFLLLFLPDKVEPYWKMLHSLLGKLPADTKQDVEAMKLAVEESVPEEKKGSTAEMLAEVKEASELFASNPEEAKRRLADCETRLKKRFSPFGKGPVWKGLVEAWIPIDRSTALGLLKSVSGSLQESFITRLNKAQPLSPAEWDILASALGMGRAEQTALKLLQDTQQPLTLSVQVLERVGLQIRNNISQLCGQGNQGGIAEKSALYGRLLGLHASTEAAGVIPKLLDELFVLFAKTAPLDVIWMARFNLLSAVLGMGAQLKAKGVDVMSPAHMESLISKTPPHLVNFVRAHGAATMAAGQVEAAYAELMEKTKQDELAEAWFLVTLVEQGQGTEAMALAKKSPRAEALLPRLRRAWLCSHPETAGSAVSPADMAGDPIGEFLAQGVAGQRAAYLRSVTQNGTRPVPGALWAGVGTEDEADGLRGFWKQLTSRKKGLDEVVREYTQRNPLYSSYSRDTKKEDHFRETLRVSGYGDYRYQSIDSAMLAALVTWGDQDPQPVRSVLRGMWEAIRPDDQMLMVDWLRNSILSRCANVFAADDEVLTGDYLAWLKRELVDKGRQWQMGNQVMNLKYPPTAPLQFCLAAAAGVSTASPARRDQILISGLEKFEPNPQLVETAAQLYNSDKQPLALEPPVKLKPNMIPAWHIGVVKNALAVILQAVGVQAAVGRTLGGQT